MANHPISQASSAPPSAPPLGDAELRYMLDLAPDGVFVADLSGRYIYIYVNAAGARLLQREKHEILGITIADLIRPSDVPRLLREREVMLKGEQYIAEWQLLRKDGNWVDVEITSNILPNGLWQGFVRDISERKAHEAERAALAQRAEQERAWLDAVFDLMPAGVWITDAQGRTVRANPARRAMWPPAATGGSSSDQVGCWAETGLPIAAHEWPAMRALTHGEVTANALVRVHDADGVPRTLRKYAAPLRDASGGITGAVVVDDDVTELYETQQKLQASERLFRTVVDLLPVGVYVADAQGRITFGNPAGERIWQGLRHVGPEEFHEYKAWWVETGEPIRPDEWAVTRAVRQGETSRSELIRIQCFDGSFRTVLNWATPLRSDAGEITGAVALNEDVSALYHTQEQLRAAVREREYILAVVAHDLRTPLSGLQLHAAALAHRSEALEGAEGLRGLAGIVREIGRSMAGLVDDLLAISVAGNGQPMLRIRAVSPKALVTRAVELARPQYEQAGLELVVAARGKLPTVQVDPDRVRRVLGNLLDNALKFTRRGGRVVVRVQPQEGVVLFSVANSGPPLQQEALDRMFEPFWHGPRQDRGGTGLGLSICRSIIEAHGGSIWAEAAPGTRVKVLFVLPAVLPQSGAAT